MSDFLSRLGARQTTEPAIRPRTVSRFESADVSPMSLRPESLSSDVAEVNLTENSFQSVSAEQTENNPTASARGSQLHANSSPTANQFRDSRATHDVDIEQRLRDLLSGVEQMAAERQRADAPARGYNSVEPSAATLHGATESAARRDSARNSATVIANIAPRAEVIPSNRSPRDTARMDIGATPREPDVVHVHIGRVEVRAVHAAPERTRAKNQSGTDNSRPLSLEKYLGAKDRK
ncbi:MAG: hypothetical protein ABJC26_16340 [Gemmatimonadaceae bacterium]